MQPISELEKSRRAHLLQEVILVTEDEEGKSNEIRHVRRPEVNSPPPPRRSNTKPKYNNNRAKVRRKMAAISRKKNR